MRSVFLLSMLFLISNTICGQQSKLLDQKSEIRKIQIEYQGKVVNAYEVSVTSVFDHQVDYFFEKELNPRNTLKIAKPLVHIKLLNGLDHQKWQEGFTYELKTKTLGILPFGGIHYILVEKIDEKNTYIQTREHNNSAKVWDHLLKFESHGENETAYTDQVTLYAGGMSWIFSRYLRMFYKMRHRKWNRLLNDSYLDH